jgi:hypothetical protein
MKNEMASRMSLIGAAFQKDHEQISGHAVVSGGYIGWGEAFVQSLKILVVEDFPSRTTLPIGLGL